MPLPCMYFRASRSCRKISRASSSAYDPRSISERRSSPPVRSSVTRYTRPSSSKTSLKWIMFGCCSCRSRSTSANTSSRVLCWSDTRPPPEQLVEAPEPEAALLSSSWMDADAAAAVGGSEAAGGSVVLVRACPATSGMTLHAQSHPVSSSVTSFTTLKVPTPSTGPNLYRSLLVGAVERKLLVKVPLLDKLESFEVSVRHRL
mmetsp:Transcript_8669/g.24920  ORF Transcript_8669/g.24920 Transcript_8669/m.24920 type:complete len:203 (+) Transcript_8669:451-1059(+)